MGNNERRYANQKHVRFETIPESKNNSRVKFNRMALGQAVRSLSHSALKLYLYLEGFQNAEDGIYLSKQDAMKTVSVSEKSYFSAIKELREKGYLVHAVNSEDKDAYVFHEKPEQEVD